MQTTLDVATDPWGVKVERVEIKDVSLPQQMQRAMATEAEASREARAKVIAAEGEMKASRALREATEVINENPVEMFQLASMKGTICILKGDNVIKNVTTYQHFVEENKKVLHIASRNLLVNLSEEYLPRIRRLRSNANFHPENAFSLQNPKMDSYKRTKANTSFTFEEIVN